MLGQGDDADLSASPEGEADHHAQPALVALPDNLHALYVWIRGPVPGLGSGLNSQY